MKIIIPMSGVGNRFLEKGYKTPKPLIEVDGMPIIEHVVKMFPDEEDFLFICNKDHIANTDMLSVLKRIKPSGQIISIDKRKLGPVHAVLEAAHLIDDDEQVIVNYCDFSVLWDYSDFKRKMRELDCDGCVTCYKGFHPHLLHPNLYAGVLADERNFMIQIKEKHSFTENKMDTWQSSGTFYFKNGAYVKKYFKELMDKDMSLNGEFYVSMVYSLIQADGLKTYVYPLECFLQWGTPDDLEEYLGWSAYFRDRERYGVIGGGISD